MPKKLYIHIGSHKTGTTSIQEALFENPEILKKHNLSYFFKRTIDTQIARGKNANNWLRSDHMFAGNLDIGFTILHSEKLAHQLSRFSGDVIISAEQFSYVFLEKELINFKASLNKYFDEIQIIVYLRRQDQQIISHHNEGSKYSQRRPTNLFYGNEPIAIPEHQKHFRLYLDYHRKLSMWANIFKKENIIIRIFDKTSLLNGDSVSDFFNTIGIPDFKTPIYTNKSTNFEKAKIGFLMNQVGVPATPLRNMINNSLYSTRKLLPKRKDAQEFYTLYRESNIALNKMFNISSIESIFEEDFSMYPIEGNELWTEEITNEALSNMLKSLNKAYGSINYNALFQAAVKLEKTDFTLSYHLMQTLYKILPEDSNVQNKLKKYTDFIKTQKNKNI